MRIFSLVFFALFFSAGAAAVEPKIIIPINEFQEVTDNFFRGARPEKEGLEALAKAGIKTIVNIDDDMEAVEAEAELAKKLGIKMISIPLSSFWTPSDQDINKILSLVRDTQNYPLFLHCQFGQDRTGLIVGLYRVYFFEWSAAEAYDEMLEKGFHPQLVFLDSYFEERANRRD